MAVPKDKKKFLLWAREETIELVEKWYKEDGCKTRSEFIERAINFYCGYLTAENNKEFLSTAISDTMENILVGFENRMASLLFKLAVETAMMMHVTAANNEIDEETLSALRGMCVEEVKRLYGRISFEDVVRFQKE